MKRGLFITIISFLAVFAYGQNIRITADERIMQKLENQKLINNPEAKHNGFRYQIFQGSSRNDAYAMNANFLNLFPEMPSYVLYEPPNFKVRVGDFRFKFEAIAFREQMVSKGITQFFIVHDNKINIPKP